MFSYYDVILWHWTASDYNTSSEKQQDYHSLISQFRLNELDIELPIWFLDAFGWNKLFCEIIVDFILNVIIIIDMIRFENKVVGVNKLRNITSVFPANFGFMSAFLFFYSCCWIIITYHYCRYYYCYYYYYHHHCCSFLLIPQKFFLFFFFVFICLILFIFTHFVVVTLYDRV